LKAAYIEQAVEASLRRLQTDYIDLYQSHIDDEHTPLEETMAAFDKLVRAGKVRHVGASNYSAARLQEAMAVSKANGLVSYVCLQPHYNLVAREKFETELLPVVQEHTIGVIPYYALAAGFLTGKYRSKDDASGKARGGTVGGQTTPFHPRPRSPGLADGAARSDLPDRKRYQRCAFDRHSRSYKVNAGSRIAGEVDCRHGQSLNGDRDLQLSGQNKSKGAPYLRTLFVRRCGK
jgi:aryl-alcohol dehydrogenase-like predicted oxidoreductase